MKIALYNAFGCDSLYEADEHHERSNAYVRLTEIADVDFSRLPPDAIVPKQLKALDVAEAELRNKFNEKLSELNVQRANLLALTHEVVHE